MKLVNEAVLGDKVTAVVALAGSDGSAYSLNPVLTTETQSSVSSSATSVVLKVANTSRKSLTIFNNSTAILYVAFGATATQATAKFPIAAGGLYEMKTVIYTGVISGIWASANGNASIYEGA